MGGFDLIIQPGTEDAAVAEVLVDGTLGNQPYRFLLDTGAAQTTVARDGYTATFGRLDTGYSMGVFASRAFELITVPTLTIGTITRHAFTIARRPEGDVDRHNLIGMDLLGAVCCHFLFDACRVSTDPAEAATSGLVFEELYLSPRSHPYITVQLGDHSAAAIWDSGSGITVADLGFISRHPGMFRPAGQSYGIDATGAQMETPTFTMTAPTIGGCRIPAHRVAGVDLSGMNAAIQRPADLILGYTTLSRANWVMDFPGKRWAISKLLG